MGQGSGVRGLPGSNLCFCHFKREPGARLRGGQAAPLLRGGGEGSGGGEQAAGEPRRLGCSPRCPTLLGGTGALSQSRGTWLSPQRNSPGYLPCVCLIPSLSLQGGATVLPVLQWRRCWSPVRKGQRQGRERRQTGTLAATSTERPRRSRERIEKQDQRTTTTKCTRLSPLRGSLPRVIWASPNLGQPRFGNVEPFSPPVYTNLSEDQVKQPPVTRRTQDHGVKPY